MKVEKKDLKKSQIELIVELSVEEFKPYIQKGAEVISKEVKIDGFRPGKVPYEVLKKKIGEMSILEESARIAINKTLGEVIAKHVEGQPVGQPKIDITKIAPNNPMEFKVTLDILPEVVLGVYKDLKIKRKKIEVTKQDIEKMLTDLQSMRASEKAVEREIKEGVLEQGGKFEDYLSSIKKTHDQMVLELLPDAVRRVKASLLIREVSIKEKIEATKEDVQKNIEEMKKKYKDNKEAVIQLNSPEYQAYILNVLTSQKAVDKLKEWNIVE